MKGNSEQGDIRPEDLTRIRAFIERSHWTFAKTMPQWPHEYTLRKDADEQEFLFFVTLIREHGYTEEFGKAVYIRLNVNGWKYWTMGRPLPETILINRARIG